LKKALKQAKTLKKQRKKNFNFFYKFTANEIGIYVNDKWNVPTPKERTCVYRLAT
jgi:hypothetical protein